MPHMARFFVSLARIPRNKMVAPNGSFAPSMIVCALFSSTLMSRPGFGGTPSPPPLSSSTFVQVVLVGTLHHIISSSVALPPMTTFVFLGVSVILASPPLLLINSHLAPWHASFSDTHQTPKAIAAMIRFPTEFSLHGTFTLTRGLFLFTRYRRRPTRHRHPRLPVPLGEAAHLRSSPLQCVGLPWLRRIPCA